MTNVIQFPSRNNVPLPPELVDKGLDAGFSLSEIAAVVESIHAMIHTEQEAIEEPEEYRWVPAYCDPDNEVRGHRYDETRHLDIKEIAKLIRQDIKAAIKAGELPKGLKTSVRIERYAGGQSLDIGVKDLGGVPLFSDDAIRNLKEFGTYQTTHDPYHEDHIKIYTSQVEIILDKLSQIQDSYNRDNSDSMTDYFDVRFYGHVRVDWEYERDLRQSIVDQE